MAKAYGLPQAEVAVIILGEEGDVLLGKAKEGFDEGKLTIPIGPLFPFESMSDAAKRITVEWAGVAVEPQHALFVYESIVPDREEHRVVVFVFARKPPNSKALKGSFWANVRDLGDYQEEMSEVAKDGFLKLSMVLQRRAQTTDDQPAQA